MKKKNIIWIAHEANVSGANLCMLEYMQLIAQNGQHQLLILPHSGNMQQKAQELGIQSIVIPFYGWGRNIADQFWTIGILKCLLRNIYAFFQLCYLFYKKKPNIVCTNTIAHCIGAIAAKITRHRHLWFIHEMGEEDFGFRLSLGGFSYRLMNFTTQNFFVNSEFVALKYRKLLPSHKILVVYNPVIVDAIYKPRQIIDKEEILLLMIGQISPSKGHNDAIKSIRILLDQGLQVRLHIYGKCEIPYYEMELQQLIQKNGLGNFVHFKGVSSNPSETITQHHMVLVCSVCEAMGRVALESMKLGVPVIGANTGGTLEIITDGITGFLYEQGNAISLASKINLLINISELDRLRTAARERAITLTERGFSSIMEFIEKV